MAIKLRSIMAAVVLAAYSGLTIPIGQAQDFCSNYNTALDNALIAYSADNRLDRNERQILKSLQRDAERIRNECIRQINKEFSKELKQINKRFSNSAKLKDKKAKAELEKSIAISNAIIKRDTKVQSLPVVSAIASTPRKKVSFP